MKKICPDCGTLNDNINYCCHKCGYKFCLDDPTPMSVNTVYRMKHVNEFIMINIIISFICEILIFIIYNKVSKLADFARGFSGNTGPSNLEVMLWFLMFLIPILCIINIIMVNIKD